MAVSDVCFEVGFKNLSIFQEFSKKHTAMHRQRRIDLSI
jgi:hypothetical protein